MIDLEEEEKEEVNQDTLPQFRDMDGIDQIQSFKSVDIESSDDSNSEIL